MKISKLSKRIEENFMPVVHAKPKLEAEEATYYLLILCV